MKALIFALLICLAVSTASGFEIVKQCGRGYVADLGNGKYLMHLEGNPYEMGYQQGCLAPEAVQKMTKEFVKSVLKGYDIPEDIIPGLIKLGKEIAKENERYIPSEFIEEMRGIADGARDRGYDVSYEDVLLLNLGFDVVLSVAYPIATPIVAWQDKKGIACDGFVAMDDATSDGRVLMGRSFMFNPEVFHEVAMLIEQYPSRGHRFVSVSAPGFVGVTAAMSSAGIAVGMDMVPAMNTKPFVSGMGCLLTARQVVQYADELSDAVNMIKGSKRGVPWLYIIGDGQGREKGGAVVEVSADKFARYMDYEYPSWAENLNLPKQIEDKDDLVVLANHYIVPEMYLTISYAVEDSLWRYETLMNLILQNYGSIDVEKGKELVDYLHPPNYGYYGEDENIPVAATRTLFDLSNLELWSLYGMYTDPWAHWKLEPESSGSGLDKAWRDAEGDVDGPDWKPMNYGPPIIDKEKLFSDEEMQKVETADGSYVEQCVKAYAGNPNYAVQHFRFNVAGNTATVSILADDQNDGLEVYAWNYQINDWQKVYGRACPRGFEWITFTIDDDFINNGKLDVVLVSEAKWKFGMIYDKACVKVDYADLS